MQNKDEHRYDFMLDMPHKQSLKRKHMSPTDRAAQFGAFRALTGYEDAVKETGRLTDTRIQLDESRKSEIDRVLRYLKDNSPQDVSVTYFVPDTKKQGGSYITKHATVVAVYPIKRNVVFRDGSVVPIDEITELSCDAFDEF